jgi:hypothetical protein
MTIRSNPWCPIWSSLHDHLILQHNTMYPSTIKDLLIGD